MNNITIDRNSDSITLQYKDWREQDVTLKAKLSNYHKLFDLVRDMHDSKRIVTKDTFDREDKRIYNACVENIYETLGNFYFALVRNESPSQEPVRKALQDYFDLWGKGWAADNRFVIMMLPFVGSYRTEKNLVVNDSGEWVEEVRKVFKQSGTVNAFSTNIERMLFDSVEQKNLKTYAQIKAEKLAKKEAAKKAKEAAKEAAQAKNVQA